MQASLEAKGQVTVLEPFLRKVGCHQLSFAGMQRWGARIPGRRIGKQGRRGRRPRPGPRPAGPVPGWAQLRLPFDAPRDYSRYVRRQHADLANPTLIRARQAARAAGEARGWTRWVANDAGRALVILLSSHAGGDTIRHSELFPVLRRHGLSAERTIEILSPSGPVHR